MRTKKAVPSFPRGQRSWPASPARLLTVRLRILA
jgi:hypothetical protein